MGGLGEREYLQILHKCDSSPHKPAASRAGESEHCRERRPWPSFQGQELPPLSPAGHSGSGTRAQSPGFRVRPRRWRPGSPNLPGRVPQPPGQGRSEWGPGGAGWGGKCGWEHGPRPLGSPGPQRNPRDHKMQNPVARGLSGTQTQHLVKCIFTDVRDAGRGRERKSSVMRENHG